MSNTMNKQKLQATGTTVAMEAQPKRIHWTIMLTNATTYAT